MKSHAQNHRGRPKGTGLDDRARLKEISDLLATDPQLKPTTAIKTLGITDPSAIRRLRDKWREMQAALDNSKSAVPAKRTRSMALNAKPEPAHQEDPVSAPPAAPSKLAEASAPTPADPSPAPSTGSETTNQQDWLMNWCVLGLNGTNAAMQMQRAYFEYVIKNPAMMIALEQHVRANDFFLACAGPGRATRKR